MAQPKSLYRSRAGSHFNGTEYEIWADFGPVGKTEKIGRYMLLLIRVFFMFAWPKKIKFKKRKKYIL